LYWEDKIYGTLAFIEDWKKLNELKDSSFPLEVFFQSPIPPVAIIKVNIKIFFIFIIYSIKLIILFENVNNKR
jgi:hypothetical protein